MFATHFRRIASVPFASKDAAKSLGCTWVQSAKGWQINSPAAETELAKIEGVAFGWHLPGDRRAWNAGFDWAESLSAADKRAFALLVQNPFWTKNPPIAEFIAKYSAS